MKEILRLSKAHPKCSDCGVMFGGLHGAAPHEEGLCRSCWQAREWEKVGKSRAAKIACEAEQKKRENSA